MDLDYIIGSCPKKGLGYAISHYITEFGSNRYLTKSYSQNRYVPTAQEENAIILNSLLSEASRILAGEYYKGNKRVWKWEERESEFDKVYSILQKYLNGSESLNQLERKFSKNPYLRKKHPKIKKRICKKLKRR